MGAGRQGPGGAGGVLVGGNGRARTGMACLGGVGRGRWGWAMVEGAGEEWRPLPRGAGRRQPRSRRPPVSAAPVALGPSARLAHHTPSGQPRPPPLGDHLGVGPALWPARCVGPRLLSPGPSSPVKLPPNGRRGLGLVLGAGSPFFSPSRLFVRRRSNPLSLWPSLLPPLAGTAPIHQSLCLSSSSHC